MTKISYFGKQNSTLGSVVPSAMFSYKMEDFLASTNFTFLQIFFQTFGHHLNICIKLNFLLKVEDFWAYLEEELVPSLYQTKWYNEGTDPMVRQK